MNIVVIGLGLIGGSMGKDLRRGGLATRLIGVDANEAHTAEAAALGLVDEVKPMAEALAGAALVLMAIPVSAIQKTLSHVLDLIPDEAVVIDTGSTKAQICEAVASHPRRSRFVAAHPIAGTENSGPSAAFEGLFQNKMNIICERERSAADALALAEQVFGILGMHTTYMEANEHDKHVAYVSHLSHVSSFLLGQTVLDIEKDEKNIFTLAGSGFASTVRLAKSSPAMWAPIFEQNSMFLRQALEQYIAHLQRFLGHLVAHETDALYTMMEKANEIRRVLQGMENVNKVATKPSVTEK